MSDHKELISPTAVLAKYEERQLKASSSFAKVVASIDAQYLSDMQSARQSYKAALESIQQCLAEVTAKLGLSAADWTDPVWDDFSPSIHSQIPAGTRFATAIFKGQFGQITTPALVPILNQGNLFFFAQGAAKKQAVQALQSALLKVVATFPPGKLQLILIDPVGLGANVAGFMNLPEKIRGSKAWTEPQQIEQQLTDLSAHMENVIQKYLRNDYKSMEEYNQLAGEVAEPYRFLGVVNFPANFTDAAAKRLISIASNGPRAGVYVICTIDADLPLPYGINLPDLLRTGSVIQSGGTDDFVWKVRELDKLGLLLDKPPLPDRFNRILRPIGEMAEQGDRVEVPFEKIMPERSEWWHADTTFELKAPLGRKGARDIQYFELGHGTRHYGLVAGKPGSGKSTLLHVLITNLALKYSPEELVLYLVDFKEGVEFKDYAEFALPHARVIGIKTEREFGLSVLKEVQEEMVRRADLCREAIVEDLTSYRTKTGIKLPRVLLIIDEFQRLFSEDDPLADQAANILGHITQQGRAFGIHLLLASQTLADAYAVGRATYDKMTIRIALQCTEADSRLILGEDNGAARLLSRPGEAVYNADNGREEGNNFFQVAWLSPQKRKLHLRHITERTKDVNYISPVQQVVFEGQYASRITGNTTLWEAICADTWPAPDSTVSVYLGESTRITPPHTIATLRPQARSNILILGQKEQIAYSILSTIWVSLCAQVSPEGAEFYVADFSRAGDPLAPLLAQVQDSIPHQVRLVRPRDFINILSHVDEIVNQRIQSARVENTRVFFVLAGLHRARELRENDEYGSPGEAAQVMAHICREGPDLGVHVITWCDTFGNLTQILDRRTLSEFDIRVALQMSEDDSNQFIESPRAKTLGHNRAYLYDLDQIGELEKFRPYELISEAEIEQIGVAFSGKQFKRGDV